MALNDRVYQLVKYSCLHSLSCEVAAGVSLPKVSATKGRVNNLMEETWAEANMESDDGVILFGDDEHGYTLSHTFRCVFVHFRTHSAKNLSMPCAKLCSGETKFF